MVLALSRAKRINIARFPSAALRGSLLTTTAGRALAGILIAVGAASGSSGDGTWPQAADFTITTQADWSAIPSTYRTNGGIIHVMPGVTFTAVTLTGANFSPTAELLFRAPTPYGAMPLIDKFILDACKNITFERLDVQHTTWASGNSGAVRMLNITNNIRFRSCTVRGAYRGNRSHNYDPMKEDYPEMAAIYCRNTAGPLSGLEFSVRSDFLTDPTPLATGARRGDYIGDLLPDGTGYTAVINVGTMGAGASCTYSVVAGYIVITAQAAGTGYTASGNDFGSGAQIQNGGTNTARMAGYLQNGFESDGTHAPTGYFDVLDCTFDTLNAVIKCNIPSSSTYTFKSIGNFFDRILQDYHSFTAGSGTGPQTTIAWNIMTRPCGRSIDPGNPHCDFYQIRMNKTGDLTDANWKDVEIYGNLVFKGLSRGSGQGMFINEGSAGLFFENFRICGNIGLNDGNYAYDMDRAKASYVYRNIFALFDTTDVSSVATLKAGSGAGQQEEFNYVGYNITEAISSKSPGLLITEGNELLTAANLTSYQAQFVNPNSIPTTRAAVLAAYAAQSGKTAGPLATSYIDYVNRTIDLTQEPPALRWDPINGATQSAATATGYSRLCGGPVAGRTATPDAGTEVSYADDAIGTNVTAWSSTPITIPRGKFVRLRKTASASLATSVFPGLTIAGVNRTATITTTSTAFAMVKNNNVGVVSRGASLGTKTDVQKVMLAMRFRYATLSSTNVLMSGSNTSGRCEIFRSSASVMSVNVAATGSGATASGNMRFTYTMDTNWHTLIAIYDTTQLTKELGIRAWLDDTEVSYDDANTGFVTGTQPSLATFASNPSIGGRHGLGGITDMECQWMAMGWGDSADSMLDMSSQLNRNKFLKDNIGSNWSAPFAGMENWIAYTGDQTAAVFNSASIPNQNGGFSAVFGNRQAGWT